MTGKELLEQLKAMTPEQLELEVITKHMDAEGYDYEYINDLLHGAEVTTVLARDILVFNIPRDTLIPAIVIS